MTEQPKPGHFHVVPDLDAVSCDRCGVMVDRVVHKVQYADLHLWWNICLDCNTQLEFADSTREKENV